MKRQDPKSSPQSFDEQETTPAMSSSATALFSRLAVSASDAPPSQQKAGASNNDVDPQGNTAHPPNDQTKETSQADHGVAPAVSPVRQVDLTGIFRKVHLEGTGNEATPGKETSTDVRFTSDSEQGFTQMFQSLAAASGNNPAPAETLSAASGNKQETPIFSENELSKRQRENSASRNVNEALYQQQGSSSSAQGEFTQHFQLLDHEQLSPMRREPRLNAPSAELQAGGFTQLLRTLSAETEAEPTIPAAASAPFLSTSANGPGEFTRIISGSMLREAQGRTIPPAQAGTSLAPLNQESAVPPAAISNPAVIPASVPIVSQPQSLAPPLLPPASMPQPQLAPPVPVPQPPQPQPAGNKLQQYLPFLLIANFFLMLLVLILIAVVLMRH